MGNGVNDIYKHVAFEALITGMGLTVRGVKEQIIEEIMKSKTLYEDFLGFLNKCFGIKSISEVSDIARDLLRNEKQLLILKYEVKFIEKNSYLSPFNDELRGSFITANSQIIYVIPEHAYYCRTKYYGIIVGAAKSEGLVDSLLIYYDDSYKFTYSIFGVV